MNTRLNIVSYGITTFFLVVLVLTLAGPGCSTPEPPPAGAHHTSEVWRADMVANVLYPDLREDGVIDYEWSDTVPIKTRRELEGRAKALVDQR